MSKVHKNRRKPLKSSKNSPGGASKHPHVAPKTLPELIFMKKHFRTKMLNYSGQRVPEFSGSRRTVQDILVSCKQYVTCLFGRPVLVPDST